MKTMMRVAAGSVESGYDMQWVELAHTELAPDEVRIEIAYFGLNRADLFQRRGLYPSPPGEPEGMGLECSGVIVEVGTEVQNWRVGDGVCALLGGGGYATHVTVPATQVLPVPEGVTLAQAAGLPEVCSTIWCAVIEPDLITPGEWLLLQGASGGVGTMLLEVCREQGMHVVALAHGEEKLSSCLEHGATVALDYRSPDLDTNIMNARPEGYELQVNMLGAPSLNKAFEHAAIEGDVVCLGIQQGPVAEVNIGALMNKRLTMHGVNLRNRPRRGRGSKAHVVAGAHEYFWPKFESGSLTSPSVTVFPMDSVNDLHRLIEVGQAPAGKLVFEVSAG